MLGEESTMTEDCFANTQPGIQHQRFRVEGQGALLLALNAGDRLLLNSVDGQQACDVFVCDAQGKPAPFLLDSRPSTQAEHTLTQLESGAPSALSLHNQLQTWGLDREHFNAAIAVNAGEHYQAEAQADITVVLVAPGQDMVVDGHHPATDVSVSVYRSQILDEYLPPPLAQVKADIRIAKCSAETYRVNAGEWIQIIDVSGKQCSDFLAFDYSALQTGLEVGINAVATRTVSGNGLPQPGLYSKFLGSDVLPLVEVVQDTVGRHDSFLMACTPKYYEDSGYFGHLSCTENFNQALASYGITPRAAWPAINFFFNTHVDPCGTVTLDEPWSRPGDYVLMRATRDLLCASSACPDDIDPANGWQPTDIHVRIYDADKHFDKSIAHRVVPQEPPRMTKTSGFHSATSQLTKHMVEYRGYWVATQYPSWGITAEYIACRERVAMIDLSPLRKFEVTGPDAEILLQTVLTRNVRRLSVGEIAYSAMCLETGGMIDDGTIFKMGEQAFRWVCGDPYSGQWMIKIAREREYRVSIRNASDQIHNVAVQGPRSRSLLKEIVWVPDCQPDMESLAWFHFLIGRLNGPDGIPIMVSRTGYTGELGYEVWCHPKHGSQVWQAIWQAGEAYDIAPLGFDALDKLRIEAGLIFAEHEFCPDTNPFEAGIGFTVPLKTKEDEFIGRSALAAQSPQSRKKLVGLVLEDNEPAAHGDPVYADRFPVGVITSATPSPLLSKQIALCRVAPEYAKPGTSLQIGKLDGQQKRLHAQVVGLPFYDPERTRVRS